MDDLGKTSRVKRNRPEYHALTKSINKKCDGREGHIRKVPIGKFEIAL